mgnify:CR=1 FL=1
MDRKENKKTYHVLYTQVMDQDKLKPRLDKKLADTGCEIFIPRMEYYRRGEKAVKIKPIFPGYTFIRTAIPPEELHDVVKEVMKESKIGIRELGFKDQRFYPCISPDEAKFLDFLCTDSGVLEMSVGYQDGKRFVVMDGPLRVFQDKIIDVDKHNRKAFLKFEIDGRRAQAGFECKPKAHWVADRNAKLATLSDGAEVDLNELRDKVLSAK